MGLFTIYLNFLVRIEIPIINTHDIMIFWSWWWNFFVKRLSVYWDTAQNTTTFFTIREQNPLNDIQNTHTLYVFHIFLQRSPNIANVTHFMICAKVTLPRKKIQQVAACRRDRSSTDVKWPEIKSRRLLNTYDCLCCYYSIIHIIFKLSCICTFHWFYWYLCVQDLPERGV